MIEKIKNMVAVKKGYPDWETMENWIIEINQPVVVAQLLVGAMEEVCEIIIQAYEAKLRQYETR